MSLIGDLLQINTRISSFILHEIEANDGHRKRAEAEQVWQLGRQLVELGRDLQRQAEERSHDPKNN